MAIYFELKGRKSYKKRLYTAVKHYTRWINGDKLSLSECKDLFEFLELEQELKEERMYDLKEFNYSIEDQWYEVFKSDPEECLYIREMLRNKEELSKPARVKLSTIHAAKGGEATNVVLLTDLTENTMKSYEKNPDDENRLFYVGATRTKENLHIIEPKKYEKGYLL